MILQYIDSKVFYFINIIQTAFFFSICLFIYSFISYLFSHWFSMFSFCFIFIVLMISIEAWCARIGSWAGRVRLSSKLSGLKMNVSVRHILDILWGISTLLVSAVISVILIVGGVELNPGPPQKDLSSSSDEDLELPKSFDFGATCKSNYVFSSPATPLPTMKYKRRVLVGSKKYPRKFGVT